MTQDLTPVVRESVEPYKGLTPYTADDASFFFGRDEEVAIVAANLMANPLTVVYGESGVGKTSLLRAGVAARLQRDAAWNRREHGTPQLAIAFCSSWRDDPLGEVLAQIRLAAADAAPDSTGTHSSSAHELTRTLEEAQERVGGEVFVILDDFEEYFLYHPEEEGEGTLAAELPRVIGRPRLPVSVIISLREDALAKLDRFKARIPALFEHYLRIAPLDREAARAAIERPLSLYNQFASASEQVSVEPALVDAVLDQVTTGTLVMGKEMSRDNRRRVETPYLQLVISRLWDEERARGSRTLRLQTFAELGGAERIARTHLDAALRKLSRDDQEIAAQIFHYLVTPTGTKIAHRADDLAAYASVSAEQLSPVLYMLVQDRIIRALEGGVYELYHDVLAAPVLDWSARYLERERARPRRRLWRRSG